ncbi:MAG TPA: hypothetical protein ENG14_01900 [Thermodesulforhabdus norvegica]|uniref:EF-hand domain-containing protein n=1 Tax=Thermodesulforhabdus norvegica TaxID=39841 RepID=A0A7C1AVI2_9BACT|nr:hypothetical protein [Thermodesulforhabdus norvegica]
MVTFFYELRKAGVPVSVHAIMDFYRALSKGLVTNLDTLFVVLRLVTVKRVEHYDTFERIFKSYFLDGSGGITAEEWERLLTYKPFREWLSEEIRKGSLPPDVVHSIPLEDLIKRFWETVQKQRGRHQGGNRWIGPGVKSPYGQAGFQRVGLGFTVPECTGLQAR